MFDVEQEGHQGAQAHASPKHEEASGHDDHQEGDVPHQVHPAEERAEGPQHRAPGAVVLLVQPVEGGPLVPLPGEGLHDPDPGDDVLDLGVDARHGVVEALEAPADPSAQQARVGHHQRHRDQADQGQLPVQAEQHRVRTRQHGRRQEQVLGGVVHRVGDPAHVVGHAGHQLPGLAVVEEAERELLDVVEQVPAHVSLHLHGHQVPGIQGVEVAAVLDHDHGRHRQPQTEDRRQVAGGQQRVHHDLQQVWYRDGERGHQARGGEVARQQVPIGPVVGEDAAEQAHG